MPNPTIQQQANAQSYYMDFVQKRAKEEALKNKRNLAFDPQGRVLLDVTLSQDDKIKILESIDPSFSRENLGAHSESFMNKALEKALGIKPTPTTTVSVDIRTIKDKKGNTPLFHQFKAKVVNEGLTDAELKLFNSAIQQAPTGSIIALQQEFHFHLGLTGRVYQEIAQSHGHEILPADLKKAHDEAMLEVNGLVMKAYSKAFQSAQSKDGQLDIGKLNKELDKARKAIMPEAHTLMRQAIVRNTGVALTKAELKKIKSGEGIKHVAERLTATANDFLHTDGGLGLATWIAGSENTAHHRVEGAHVADRQIITCPMNSSGDLIESKNPRIQVRTPSLPLKEGLSDEAYIDDVVTKLNHIDEKYDFKTVLSDQDPKAYIYNSYTALNDFLGDRGGNLQTQSADHILRGAHRHNANQLESPSPVFCLVQNISTNGFGDELGYNNSNSLVKETTLMAELSMLHTLYDTADEDGKYKINDIFTQYKLFLELENPPKYFSESESGKEAISKIQELKTEWAENQEIIPAPESPNMLENAKRTLKHLMVNNLHFNKDYSILFQSLSVFVEEASIGGCKSGNERAQAINGRVAILDSINNIDPRDLSEDEAIINQILGYKVINSKDIKTVADELKNALDRVYNEKGLQAGVSAISELDQGAAAGVQAKKPFFNISRNFAEVKQSVMTNLHQAKSKVMQAHKSMTEMMVGASDGHSKSFWSRMKSNPLGVVGAVLGIITVVPALIVGVRGVMDNAARKSTIDAADARDLKDFRERPPQAVASSPPIAIIAPVPVVPAEDYNNLGADMQEHGQLRDSSTPGASDTPGTDDPSTEFRLDVAGEISSNEPTLQSVNPDVQLDQQALKANLKVIRAQEIQRQVDEFSNAIQGCNNPEELGKVARSFMNSLYYEQLVKPEAEPLTNGLDKKALPNNNKAVIDKIISDKKDELALKISEEDDHSSFNP